MKILSILLARSVWAGHIEDLSPHGRSNPDLLEQLKNRYSFQITPTNIYQAIKTNQLATFEGGVYKKKSGETIVVGLHLAASYTAADTRSSTQDSDEFLEDVYTWLGQQFEMTDYRQVFTQRMYVNTMTVAFAKPLNMINPKIAALGSELKGQIPGFPNFDFEIGAIHFWPDTTQNPRPAPIRFERQEGTKLSDGRYFVSAPLPTDQHIALLERFEKALG